MEALRVGHSLDKVIDMGAVVSEDQKRTIEEYVESAKAEGADVFQIPYPEKGCFYPPTLITGVNTASRVVEEEIFGPVLVALPFRTAKEAITIANNTIYGLAASVHTEQLTLALETAKNIKAGTVWINCHNVFDAAAGL
jgi:aldehyde dehydrogenase (NAD+)